MLNINDNHPKRIFSMHYEDPSNFGQKQLGIFSPTVDLTN